jgi:hypothetical protein
MEHLMDPLTGLMKALGNPEVTDELKQTIIEGVLHEAGNRSVDQLAQEENEALVGLLKLRAKNDEAALASQTPVERVSKSTRRARSPREDARQRNGVAMHGRATFSNAG